MSILVGSPGLFHQNLQYVLTHSLQIYPKPLCVAQFNIMQNNPGREVMADSRKYSEELNAEIRFMRSQYPKLSQAKIAKRLDCSQTYVSRVLNNFSKNANDKLESIPDLALLLVDTLLKLKTMPMSTQVANSIAKNASLLYQVFKENQVLIGTLRPEQLEYLWNGLPGDLRDRMVDVYKEYRETVGWDKDDLVE